MKFFTILALVLSFGAYAQKDDCGSPTVGPDFKNWNPTLFACFNFYVDLGEKAANEKCKTLIKTETFTDKNFSRCIEIFQPSRAEWKSTVTDRCLELYKKHDFLSKNFLSCMDAFGIYDSGAQDFERRDLRIFAGNKCLIHHKKVDFTSKSFINCFYFYGANHYPGTRKKAQEARDLADVCAEQVQKIDFSDPKMVNCWDKKRGPKMNAKQIVSECLKEL